MSAKKRLASFVAAVALASGGLFVMAPKAEAATNLGGVDLRSHCRATLGGSHTYVENRSPYNAYSWKCWYGNQLNWWTFRWAGPYSIDVNAACRRQYGGGAWAYTSNSSNPYSWRCYR